MSTGGKRHLLAVVALPTPLEVGTTFARAEWPPHVTLASNFFVDLEPAEVGDAVRGACAEEGLLVIRFGSTAQFGRDKDVQVQLVESAQVVALHERLADRLEALPDFAAEQPLYWRAGYRPHMTRVEGRDTRDGDELILRHAALARLDGAVATVVDQFRF